MKKIIRLIFWALLFLFVGSCFFAWGYTFGSHEAQTYQAMAVQTCEYSLKLTDLVNSQFKTIELIDPTKTYERLDYLNCSSIK